MEEENLEGAAADGAAEDDKDKDGKHKAPKYSRSMLKLTLSDGRTEVEVSFLLYFVTICSF